MSSATKPTDSKSTDRKSTDTPLPLAIRLRYWPTLLQLALMRLVALLPLPAVRLLGAAIGTLLWPIAAERRRITLRNLELCFPEKTVAERQQLARANFRHTAMGFMETAKVWFSKPATLAKHVDIEGLEHLQAAVAKGKGVLVLGFHLTDLELGAVTLARHCQLAGMYRPHADPVFERAMRAGRERHFPMIPRDDVRAMLRWLKQGGCVWYAADQDYGAQHSVFAPFFGHPAATITATSRFAKLSGATVIPFTHRRTRRGIALQLHPALATIPSGDEHADAGSANQFLERWLQQHPADYLWLHRRFKTRPPGEPSLYPARKPRYRAGEISGKRYDKWLRQATVLQRHADGSPARLQHAMQLIDVFPERSLFGRQTDTENQRLETLRAWQLRGIAVAQPERILCPARHVVLHRYTTSVATSVAEQVLLANALRRLHDQGHAIAAAALHLATTGADAAAVVLPRDVTVIERAALSSEQRHALLADADPALRLVYDTEQARSRGLAAATNNSIQEQ